MALYSCYTDALHVGLDFWVKTHTHTLTHGTEKQHVSPNNTILFACREAIP